ncbi:MAG TPA: ABC-F family ATP-binding cassette domain-containing protein, partial [Gaiellaceae bacterium]
MFTDLSLTLSDGDRIGVVGLNGCGKSTLLTMMSGEREPEAGVVRRGRNTRVGALPQLPVLPAGTVRSAVCDGLDRQEWQGEAMLSRLGMGGVLDASTDQLSGGQKKRVALAALLAREWDALILDEPTNHLDLDAIAYLEEWLAAFPGGLLLVTHDRHVLDRVTNKVLEIDRGASYLHVPHERTGGSGYAAYLAARIVREAQAATEEQTRKNLARHELAWLRRGAPARTSKPKARIDAANALLARGPAASAREGELGLALGSTRLGSKGVELHGVGFSWPSRERDAGDAAPLLVLKPFDLMLEPGDRVGIVGPNGAGKSTLLDLIAGRLQPTQGSIEIGRTVKVGYYDQLGRDLDPEQSVRDAVAGGKGEPTLDDVKLMRQFWFDGDAQFAPISTLSGGERRRLQLLLTLIEQPNLLLLDEPTNDLDLDTLRALEEFLDGWPGIVVVVSHDRVFLDRTVNEVMALDGSGRAVEVRGGVAGWLAQRAAQPTRITGTAGWTSPAPGARRSATPPATRPMSRKSPSTLRRQLGLADRELAD